MAWTRRSCPALHPKCTANRPIHLVAEKEVTAHAREVDDQQTSIEPVILLTSNLYASDRWRVGHLSSDSIPSSTQITEAQTARSCRSSHLNLLWSMPPFLQVNCSCQLPPTEIFGPTQQNRRRVTKERTLRSDGVNLRLPSDRQGHARQGLEGRAWRGERQIAW